MALLKMPACMRTARIPAALATVAWVASIFTPSPSARRTSVRMPVEAMNVFDGTQSHSTQAPPIPSESMTVMSAP